MAVTPHFPQLPYRIASSAITSGDGTTQKLIFTSSGNGAMLRSLMLTNDSASTTYTVQIFSNTGNPYGEITLPPGAGQDGVTPQVDWLILLEPSNLFLDKLGNKFFLLGVSEQFRLAVTSSLSGIERIEIRAIYLNF